MQADHRFNLIFVSFHNKRVFQDGARGKSDRASYVSSARCISNLVRAQKKRMRSPWKGEKSENVEKQASKQGTESVKRSGK